MTPAEKRAQKKIDKQIDLAYRETCEIAEGRDLKLTEAQRKAMRSLSIGPDASEKFSARVRAWLLANNYAQPCRWDDEGVGAIFDPAGKLLGITDAGREVVRGLLREEAEKTKRTNRAARAFWARHDAGLAAMKDGAK